MRPILFVFCFTLGVGLMVFSGYLPKSASARGNGAAGGHGAANTLGAYPRYGNRVMPVVSRSAAEGEDCSPLAPDDEPPEQPPGADPAETDEAAAAAAALAAIAAQFAGTPAVESSDDAEEAGPPPVADAGRDRVIWIGWDELPLDGTRSTGDGLRYDWMQVSGPQPLTIRAPDQPKTSATGLPLGLDMSWADTVYEFDLMVVDQAGREAFDTVRYTVRAGPELAIDPPARRRFEMRDGYLLGHYEAWTTNLETYESTFRITAPGALTFTKVSGGVYDLAGGAADDGYAYRVTLYGRRDEAYTWVELLVDTAEKIPGIVQLGVNWEER